MLSFFRHTSLVAAVLIASACDGSDKNPTSPLPASAQLNGGGADRFVQEHFYDLTDSYTAIECDDGRSSELVALSGQIFERFTFQFNPAGNVNVRIHTMPIGLKGVGTVSGEEYRVREQESSSYNQTPMGAVGSYRQVLKLVAVQSHLKYALVFKGHYTVNANGEVSVDRSKLVLKCEE